MDALKTLDIVSNSPNKACRSLSNFAAHRFVLDGVECESMEGFLQSLKFKDPDLQEHVCSLVGIGAKRRGASKDWQSTQTLWWRGQPIKRDSQEYQDLLDRAFTALCDQSARFRDALLSTKSMTLTHRIGRSDPKKTVLTASEFCNRLMKLREVLSES